MIIISSCGLKNASLWAAWQDEKTSFNPMNDSQEGRPAETWSMFPSQPQPQPSPPWVYILPENPYLSLQEILIFPW